METIIATYGRDVAVLAVLVGVLWFLFRDLKRDINVLKRELRTDFTDSITKVEAAIKELIEGFDEHKASYDAHALRSLKYQLGRMEARLNGHLNGN